MVVGDLGNFIGVDAGAMELFVLFLGCFVYLLLAYWAFYWQLWGNLEGWGFVWGGLLGLGLRLKWFLLGFLPLSACRFGVASMDSLPNPFLPASIPPTTSSHNHRGRHIYRISLISRLRMYLILKWGNRYRLKRRGSILEEGCIWLVLLLVYEDAEIYFDWVFC